MNRATSTLKWKMSPLLSAFSYCFSWPLIAGVGCFSNQLPCSHQCIRVGSWKHPLNYWMLVQGQNLASLQIKRQRANQFSKWQGIYGVTKTAPFFLSTGMSLRARTSDIENIGEISHHTRFFWSKSKKHIFLNLNRDNIFTQFMKKG